jgi:hypothetical protein
VTQRAKELTTTPVHDMLIVKTPADELITERIKNLAKEIIKSRPGGIRYTELKEEVVRLLPGVNPLTVGGRLPKLPEDFPDEISKPERGLFVWIGAQVPTPMPALQNESDYYGPFAEWLKDDLEEVTSAVELGGSAIRGKWGTPDVVGVLRPKTSDLVKFHPEIVAVEIKIDPSQSVVAFGQAVAYRLFSSKSYVVMPGSILADDLIRLESLCVLFGVGLAIFDPARQDPEFRIRVRALRNVPDMYYVNEFAERLKSHDQTKFDALFG